MALAVRDGNNNIVNFTTTVDPSGASTSQVNTEGAKATYSVVIPDYTTVAATATDIFTLVGSATKTVRVTRVSISGSATAAAQLDYYILKRTTANTGGTSAAVTTIVKHDTTDAAQTAVPNTYSANPTGLGTGNIARASAKNFLAAAGTAVVLPEYVATFGNLNDRAIVLRGVAESLAINLNGQAIPAGISLYIDVEWTEE